MSTSKRSSNRHGYIDYISRQGAILALIVLYTIKRLTLPLCKRSGVLFQAVFRRTCFFLCQYCQFLFSGHWSIQLLLIVKIVSRNCLIIVDN